MLTIYYAQKSELMSDVFWEWCYQQLPQNISDKIKQKSSQKKTQSSLLGYLLLKESLKQNLKFTKNLCLKSLKKRE